MDINIQTGIGIAPISILIIEVLKQLFIDMRVKSYPWYPALLNLATLVISFGLAFLAMLIFDVELITTIVNGLTGYAIAIGCYETVVNTTRGVFKKANK